MVSVPISEQAVWDILRTIPDPEIPVLSLIDLGIVTRVRTDDGAVEVTLCPTFSGCPALHQMRMDVEETLVSHGCTQVTVIVDQRASWTTDLLAENARRRLQAFGIAPPPPRGESLPATLALPVKCPHCGSSETKLDSEFGATLCKQLYLCNSCHQAFERFKPL
ncbi:MAG: phenylacetate-CoA oxygenase subunit PaaJ [Ignavibacteria bacterium GWA2_55_11]|nr:MAG: phenylacetate-CoA oxygenase subunit PaaJ [Ignavibacteria bacterium GWA2_55_11]OGU44629.1 MAG: phenylacetate-CoA oxygenase subunit PaaJ [Ignavibacteria bacterium GWC2_56_12]OGU62906.1 MAG: phenylacetate-CoA oxygenase subunit PaaJ [Ignavibacteria bacterium RIFCSPHIGHO2_02_FULL_56_12]OGU68999.1 MAG: phenylacetate-CoA oxygenase subunit PaaJ [Ignavibacteria bacterium RIFCSPLOWO2_02_FULL_55_14]OGU76149.1 MAG: phenylacetate-CoA oxygenase subunit PaaJ [Ignavibacteria bacterium RIFCSPLOWO2_12_FU